jgi:hypothetical protein
LCEAGTLGRIVQRRHTRTHLLARLKLSIAVDFRNMYAVVIDQWCDGDASSVLNGKFEKMAGLKA